MVGRLCKYAEHEFRQSRVVKGSSSSLRSHQAQIDKTAREIGWPVAQTEPAPTLPEELAHVWTWYTAELRSAQPLTYQEIKAWAEVTGTKLFGWEAELLKSLDRISQMVLHE